MDTFVLSYEVLSVQFYNPVKIKQGTLVKMLSCERDFIVERNSQNSVWVSLKCMTDRNWI